MTAPTDTAVEAVDTPTGPAGEMAVNFPVVVLEGHDTSDGRYLAPDSLSFRALPITLLAQLQSAHGGDEPGAATVVGRIDTLVRTPGPQVVSARTGQPFPEGTFVWSGTGAISTTATIDGHNVADLVRRRFLRGVSVDLAGMDYEILGEGELAVDPEHPRRQIVCHSAELAAATLCPIPAFGDAYVELAGDSITADPVALEDIPAGLVASVFPAWRSAEVGDYPVLVAAAAPAEITVPDDAADQLVKVIEDDGGEQRDASALAKAIVDYVTSSWVPAGLDPVDPEVAGDGAAADLADQPADPAPAGDMPADTGMPDAPQPCALGPEDATHSLMFADNNQYLPVCDDHDQDGRQMIADEGETVSGEVPIGGAADTSSDEETTS